MNKQDKVGLIALLFTLLVGSCIQPPNYPDIPEIFNAQLLKTVLFQGSPSAPRDTLILTFEFRDGDGDLSFPSDSIDVILTESRFGLTFPQRLPYITEEGVGNGISGVITIRQSLRENGICCIANQQNCTTEIAQDTFSYLIQIRDRAGNMSNQLRTETITLLCE